MLLRLSLEPPVFDPAIDQSGAFQPAHLSDAAGRSPAFLVFFGAFGHAQDFPMCSRFRTLSLTPFYFTGARWLHIF